MTDDKGAGEGPYKIVRKVGMTPLTVEGPTGNHGLMLHGRFLRNVLNAAYEAGRKAERERCLAIANRHPDKCDGITLSDCMETIKDEIRGGQDGK